MVGRRILAHGSGLQGLFLPAFVGHVRRTETGASALTGRFIPLPGGLLAELCAGLLALHFWLDSSLLAYGSLLALGIEIFVRYRLCWQLGIERVSEALERAVEAGDHRHDP
jgi:hypothetical protein